MKRYGTKWWPQTCETCGHSLPLEVACHLLARHWHKVLKVTHAVGRVTKGRAAMLKGLFVTCRCRQTWRHGPSILCTIPMRTLQTRLRRSWPTSSI